MEENGRIDGREWKNGWKRMAE
jgi:hypothetical protein